MPINLIYGTDDDDFILGTAQSDLILAGLGDDDIVPMAGNDTVFGEGGNDTVNAYSGSALLYGGDGNDRLTALSADFLNRVYGGEGNDQITIGGTLVEAYGGNGDDAVSVYIGEGGAVYGGAGIDSLRVQLFNLPDDERVIAVATGSGAGVQVGSVFLSIFGFEQLIITTRFGDDYVSGGDLGDRIDVGTGSNTVLAGAGDDFVAYYAGAENVLLGGEGNDTLQARTYGLDEGLTLVVSGTTGVDGHGSVLTGFEHWWVRGAALGDLAQLGEGRDVFTGNHGNDTCFGMGGSDRLGGNPGRDLLFGGSGDDNFNGGDGIDTLTGGSGDDRFHLSRLDWAGDLIMDFLSGADRIMLNHWTLSYALPHGAVAEDRFHLDAAVGDGGQFIYRDSDTAGIAHLIWDANGTAAGGETLVARLWGAPDLEASDIFIL